jgi:hypothetical protein
MDQKEIGKKKTKNYGSSEEEARQAWDAVPYFQILPFYLENKQRAILSFIHFSPIQ